MFCGSADSAGLSGEMTGLVGAGLKVAFNTEDTERTETRKREQGGFGGEHGKW